MNNAIEITKNFCIFMALCSLAGLCGMRFLTLCFTKERKRFFGPLTIRIKTIFSVTHRFVKWKANCLLGEPVFSLAA